MTFEPAKNFLFAAAAKYRLDNQAKASLICEKVRQVIQQHFEAFYDSWQPLRVDNSILIIKAEDSAAASELFLQTQNLLELIQKQSLPENITEIRIQKY